MPINNEMLDALILASEAFETKHANTPYDRIPKDELQAQRDRDILIANSSPEQLAVACAANRSFQSEADRKLLYTVPTLADRRAA